ncbi:twitch domain-containing radical SAM protein [Saprospiraceae bacterium]|jgi:hypothetical protein|nr:twitch domain-containing radical SAM protein [Saprospiraceae bacterium]|tara:strand:+ start:96 stop:1619 length:1524 start_codon:yes stop_codon:yes gene_type:complete
MTTLSKEDHKDIQVGTNMSRGGPGDKSLPGDYETDAWFELVSDDTKEELDNNPISITAQAKNKDLWFCSIPFSQVYSEIDGQYQACCFGAPSGVMVDQMSLVDWMETSDYMNNIRKEMLDPNSDFKSVEKTCVRCRSDERRYGRSRRTNCMKIHTNDPQHWDGIERTARFFKETGEYIIDERILEVQLKVFGSECNLDCHMCFHANSSMRWDMAKNKEVWNEKIWGAGPTDKLRIDHINNSFKNRASKDILKQICELSPHIRSIKIIGGEPLIMKRQYELLDMLIESGDSKDIFLKFQTNFTKLQAGKHKFVNYIPHFGNIAMVASVDGIGTNIEYMRRRTDWKELEGNIDICNKYPNVVVDFNSLISFLSVMRFDEVIDYCKDNDKIHQINWAMIEKPKHLRVNNLPFAIKNDLMDKYKDFPDIQHALSMPPENDVDIQDLFEYLLKQDESYVGTKWELHLFDVYPELRPYYEPRERTPEMEAMFKRWEADEKAASEELVKGSIDP